MPVWSALSLSDQPLESVTLGKPGFFSQDHHLRGLAADSHFVNCFYHQGSNFLVLLAKKLGFPLRGSQAITNSLKTDSGKSSKTVSFKKKTLEKRSRTGKLKILQLSGEKAVVFEVVRQVRTTARKPRVQSAGQCIDHKTQFRGHQIPHSCVPGQRIALNTCG